MSARWLGASCFAGALVMLPPLLACSCDGPPRLRGCRDPISDFSTITDVRIVGAGGVSGPQGGSHFQFQIEVTGTGLGRCISQRSELLSGGAVLDTVEASVQADPTATGVLSTPIYHFEGIGGPRTLRVTTLGRTLELAVETSGSRFGELDANVDRTDASLFPSFDGSPDGSP